MRLMRTIRILLLLPFLGFMSSAYADYAMNMPRGVTPLSHDVYDLHMTIFWVCVAIGVVVFGILLYVLIMHRKSRGVIPATFHGNTRIEILWAVIPFIILVIMAIPATRVLMDMEDNSKADINIKIVGYQWKWEYEYLDEGISFFSNLATPMDQIKGKAPKDKWYLLEVDNPVVVPINKKVRFLITANDVIHSWWVPELAIKRDAIPGFIHEGWARIEKPGVYRGQCAELCGVNHGFMPIVVVAKTQEDYDKWVAEQKAGIKAENQKAQTETNRTWTLNELMVRGKEVYESNCALCHKVDGKGSPGTYPSIVGSQVATGPISNQISTVFNGVPGTAMPAFSFQLNDVDLAAALTYQRNAWGNADKAVYGEDAGGLVQPAEIAELRS